MPSKAKNKSRPVFAAKNPCNEFLVQHLIQARNRGAGVNPKLAQKDHRFFMYSTAMDSIRKYPLPIVCEEQLKTLIGIGDYLACDLLAAIRTHYRKFLLPKKAEVGEYLNNTGGVASYNGERVALGGGTQKCRSEGQSVSEEDQEEEKDRMRSFFKSGRDGEESCSQSQSSKGESSSYRPRAGSQGARVVRMLKMKSPMGREEMENMLFGHGQERIKQWRNCREQLMKHEFIVTDSSCEPNGEDSRYTLTQKGRRYAEELESKQSSRASKEKVHQEIKVFKEKFKGQDEEKSLSNSSSQAFSRRGGFCYGEESSNEGVAKGLTKEKVLPREGLSLLLVIDTREMKDHSEKGFFQEKMAQKYSIETQTSSLAIGDFCFLYEGKVLDFIIQRKKADDLSSSIIDGRYKEQKHRLKNCGASNIFYIYEGHPSSSSTLHEKELNNSLKKTRIVDGFIVCKTKSINETAKFLAFVHSQLKTKIQHSPHQLLTLGPLDLFNRKNAKSRLLTIEQFLGLALKSFPSVGKQTVSNLIRYFKSFRLLHDKLAQLEGDEERVQFLNGLLKGGRTQFGVTKMIVDILFKQS